MKNKIGGIIYAIGWLFVGLVSAYDTYWIVKNRDILLKVEKNPLGILLIKLDGGDVSLFVWAKVAGTVLVLGTLVWLYRKKCWAWPCMAVLVAVQIFVLWYLNALI